MYNIPNIKEPLTGDSSATHTIPNMSESNSTEISKKIKDISNIPAEIHGMIAKYLDEKALTQFVEALSQNTRLTFIKEYDRQLNRIKERTKKRIKEDCECFHKAVCEQDLKTMNLFLEDEKKSYVINSKNKKGETALIFASSHFHRNEPVAALLNNPHTDVNITDSDDRSALMILLNNNRFVMAYDLVKDPRTDVNLRNKKGMTALMIAIQNPDCMHPKVIDALLCHPRIDINIMDNQGRTALSLALKRNVSNFIEDMLRICHPDVSLTHLDDWDDTNYMELESYLKLHPTNKRPLARRRDYR
jgi:ankyrin repeat protein